VTSIRFPSFGIRDELASPYESLDKIIARNSPYNPLESEANNSPEISADIYKAWSFTSSPPASSQDVAHDEFYVSTFYLLHKELCS
jgi:hypothetical protein